ncbi:MAG: hypothetical protein QW638_04850 [Candidatus Bathyarchaeia archaeon]|nr:hypothetical protein [Candidatus Bathyarchaeota archaeon]
MNEWFIPLLGATLSIFAFSFLYRDNPFFKFAEHTIVGVAVGIELYSGYQSILKTGWVPLISGSYILIPAMILGLMTLGRLNKRTIWISNYPLCILMGIGLGLAVRGAVIGQLIDQIRATLLPMATPNMMNNFNNFLIVVGTTASTMYFIFTRSHTGALGTVTKIGRYFIMAAMGATFGSMSLTFTSPVIGPAFLMFREPGIYITAVAAIIILIDIIRRRR